jgi:hypothetical protein
MIIRGVFPTRRPIGIDLRPPFTKLLVARMALHLLRLGATGSEREAVRALSSGPFRLDDVTALAEDALSEARQSTVATTMARSR